jgi:hypothetical protein
MRAAVDGAVTMDSYNTLSQKIAKYLAEKNKEVSVKVDPAYLADIRAQNSAELEMLKEQNREIMEGIRQSGRLAAEDNRQENRQKSEDQKQTNREKSENQKQKGRKEIQKMKNQKKKSSVNVTGGGKQDATTVNDLFNSSTSPYTTASSDSGTNRVTMPEVVNPQQTTTEPEATEPTVEETIPRPRVKSTTRKTD